MLKDKQPVVCADPMVELIERISKRVFGETLPADINALLAEVKMKNKRFIPPTLQEVEEEMKRIGVQTPDVYASKFWNHYETNGWKRGKTKMTKWKSALAQWDLPKQGAKKLIV